MELLSILPLTPIIGKTSVECILALSGASWYAVMMKDAVFVSRGGGGCVRPLRRIS